MTREAAERLYRYLQQEEQENKPNLLISLKEYFEKTPKEQLDADWEKLKVYNEIGPDIETYCKVQREQQEVDLKKETKEWVNLMVGASFPEQDGDFISEEDYRSVIRQTALHFYELGQSQMPMPEDTVLFQKGVAEGRRLEREDMMKDVVEGEVYLYYSYKRKSTAILVDIPIEDLGDKVRIIIVKDESK